MFQPIARKDRDAGARNLKDYAKIPNKREDQTRNWTTLADILDKLPQPKKPEKHGVPMILPRTTLSAQLKQKQEMLIIKAVREVDLNIEHKRKQVEEAQKGIQEAEKVFNDTQNSILDLEISMQESRRQLDDIQQYLDDNAVDSGLVENLAAVKHIFQTFINIDAQYNEMLGKIDSDTGLIQELEKMRDGLDAKYNEVLIQTQDAAEKYRSMAEAIKTLLRGSATEDGNVNWLN